MLKFSCELCAVSTLVRVSLCHLQFKSNPDWSSVKVSITSILLLVVRLALTTKSSVASTLSEMTTVRYSFFYPDTSC